MGDGATGTPLVSHATNLIMENTFCAIANKILHNGDHCKLMCEHNTEEDGRQHLYTGPFHNPFVIHEIMESTTRSDLVFFIPF